VGITAATPDTFTQNSEPGVYLKETIHLSEVIGTVVVPGTPLVIAADTIVFEMLGTNEFCCVESLANVKAVGVGEGI